MTPSRYTCDEAKAIYHTHLFYSPWASLTRMKIYLPLVECRECQEEVQLLNRISSCLDNLELVKEDSATCQKLLHEFDQRFCHTEEVKEESRKISEYLENM